MPGRHQDWGWPLNAARTMKMLPVSFGTADGSTRSTCTGYLESGWATKAISPETFPPRRWASRSLTSASMYRESMRANL